MARETEDFKMQYELVRKIKPKLLAKRLAEGVKAKDLRVALPYIMEVKKDLVISQNQPDTLVQITMSEELNKLAT